MAHTCTWVKLPAMLGREAKYCGKTCNRRMVRDEDHVKRWKYDSFCPEHQKLADKEVSDEK